ncbi:uncharacterized protein LOC132574463 [Heteronotia binoei]|uniref:uncharacterized protein LOC132574463 n=1 Tax=Heteronotia binoei TaxID=13085 RepID=UPI00293013B3|nr:uncharacterized protein LOC132574463 [Heteronotia binoei]
MPIQGSENISSADLQTINTADLGTHTTESPLGSSSVNPSNALQDQDQDQDFTAEHPAEESLHDDVEEEEGCSIQRGEPGDAVLSEQEGEEGDASAEQLPVSSAQQRKDESLQSEVQHQRRVAMLNNVAEKMMSQSRLDHADTMQRFDRLLSNEDRRFFLLEGEGERDRQALKEALKEATKETVDVMRAAVDMLGTIAQIIREGRTQARVGEVPATATSPPSVTHRQLHLNCDCSNTRGALPSDVAYPVLAEDSMPENQSLLCPAPCSSGSVVASRRGKKRSCTGKQRVYFEP